MYLCIYMYTHVDVDDMSVWTFVWLLLSRLQTHYMDPKPARTDETDPLQADASRI